MIMQNYLKLFALTAFSLSVSSQSLKYQHSRRIGFEGQIISKLFADYDSFTRPPVQDSADHSSIVVILSIFIDRINWVHDSAEISLYLRQQWEDNRLIYEVDSREEIDEIVLPQNKRIWVPDTYFATGNEIIINERKRIAVEPTGYVRSSEMRVVTVTYDHVDKNPIENVRRFKLRVSSYMYPMDDIVYMWANSPPIILPVEVSAELQELNVYKFQSAVADDCVGNFTVGIYSCIDVEITFVGPRSRAVFTLFIPSILLVLASWLHFWVHGSWSVPRTASASLPFFIFVAVMMLYQKTNRTSEEMNAAEVWLLFCSIITFASLTEYFVVICGGIQRRIHFKDDKNNDESPLTFNRETMDTALDSKCANFKRHSRADLFSRIAFPILFVAFLVAYIVIYLI